MGMFDYIRCEAPLPDGWEPKGPLQTKDFDCEMVTHTITKDGRLMLDRGHNEDVPKAERPYPDAKPGSLDEIIGCIRRVPKYEDANFHGHVRFYSYEGDPNAEDGSYRWHEYNAKFTNGQLDGIETVSE